jgi:hypothetical protein
MAKLSGFLFASKFGSNFEYYPFAAPSFPLDPLPPHQSPSLNFDSFKLKTRFHFKSNYQLHHPANDQYVIERSKIFVGPRLHLKKPFHSLSLMIQVWK